MARVSPIVTLVVVVALCGAAVFAGASQPSAPPEPISGVLFSVKQASCTSAGLTPSIEASSPVTQQAIPAVPQKDRAEVKAKAGKAGRQARRAEAITEPAPAVSVNSSPAAALPVAVPVVLSTTALATVALPEAKPAPKPEAAGPAAFGDLDEALRQSPTTQALNLRVKKGGVVFRITHVGKARGRAAARFALANEEAADFFLSVVNVSAGDSPIPAGTVGPYVCRAGDEIFGVVHFTPEAASGKRLTVTLVQSGGERRRFQLALEYPF